MHLWPLLFLLSASVVVRASEAVVHTRDGRMLDGLVRLETNRVIVVDSDAFTITPVETANLLRITFDRPQRALLDDGLLRFEPRLPDPWQQAAIGTAKPGNTLWGSGIFRLYSGGANLGRTGPESLQLVSKEVEGDSEIIARLLDVPGRAAESVAGLMMRSSLGANAPFVFVGLLGADGSGVVQWRASATSATLFKYVPGLMAPAWLRLKRDGDQVTAYVSRNGRRWQFVEQISLPIGRCYVGLAAATQQSAAARGLNVAAPATFDQVREARSLPLTSFVPRARLRSGSIVVGAMTSLRDDAISFLGPIYKPPLRWNDIASLQFQWLPRRDTSAVELGRAGILLANGEFVDGEFRGLVDDRVRLSSILFGLRNYRIHDEVKAVVLQRTVPSPVPYEIETWDGSVWRASEVEIGHNEIQVREPMLGRMRIPIYDLYTIRPAG